MADVRTAWNETGDQLGELGRKLKVHYDSQHGGESQQTREDLTDAARRLGSAVQDAFEAIGTAARDKTVQDDVKQVGQSLAEALGATLGQAAGELKRAFSERKGQPTSEPSAGTAPVSEPEPEAAVPPASSAGGEPPTDQPPTDQPPTDQPPKVEPWGTP